MTDRQRKRFLLTGAVAVLTCAVTLYAQAVPLLPADGNPRTVYLSTGDNQDVLDFAPLDSPETVVAAFDALHGYQVSRVWWRGGQDEIWGKEFLIRPENRFFARLWDWWKDCQYRKLMLNSVAVVAAHERGMEIWLTYGLFDSGSQADAGYVGFPYAVEDRLRIDHPEWAPVNKWGTWRQGGPLEFAYPEARKALTECLVKYVVEGGYDGMALLTYAENFSQRYEDEFGYNEPVAAAFKERHGVDIRREPFDKDAWARLRGEFVETFLRELRSEMAKHGKKLAIVVDGRDPTRPTLWNVDGGVRTAGNIQWSPGEWAASGVVDELCLFSNAEEATLAEWARVGQPGLTVSAFRTRGNLPPGMPRVMWLGRDIESGYPWESWVDWPDERLAPEPAANLDGGDVQARRRLLTCVLRGTIDLPLDKFAKALQDEDTYVRRTAVRVLSTRKYPASISIIEVALNDPENSVRCQAVLALAGLRDPDIVGRILVAIAREDATFQFTFRAVPEALKGLSAEGLLRAEDKALLVRQLAQADVRVLEPVLYYFTLIGAPATPEVQTALTRIVQSDPSPYARELAMVNLQSSFGPQPDAVRVLQTVMEGDPDHAVQCRAAIALATMYARAEPGPGRTEVFASLVTFFRQYGDDCTRKDAEWGWRALGNAMLLFGGEAESAFRGLMGESENRALSDRAWRVLYLRQGDQFFRVTEEQDAEAHALHPWLPLP